MYTLIKAQKKSGFDEYDYVFKDFKSFYELARQITIPLTGRYRVAVKCEKVEDILKFLTVQEQYASLDIKVYTPDSVIQYLTMRDQSIVTKDTHSDYETFVDLCSQKNILFEKGVMGLLYSSIEHEYADMDEALTTVVREYGEYTLINEKMLAPLFVLNKTVYPRTVLLHYLWMDRYRESKLHKCLGELGNGVLVGAMTKNIKAIHKKKAEYLRTGQGDNLIRSLSSNNINLMYRVLVLERKGLNDATILLSLYERGLTAYDLVQE